MEESKKAGQGSGPEPSCSGIKLEGVWISEGLKRFKLLLPLAKTPEPC
jgi:hypothetical protein